MSNGGERLPYPGLRSFAREETDLFFGREGCVDSMVDRLAATRFLAVLGPSGSGKSSLVRTGLLDALEIGLLHQAGSRWLIADFRPGDRPLTSMAEGMVKASAEDPSAPADEEEVKLLNAFLARGPRSVVEWCEAGSLPEGANLLLLVDQFEELFRYSAYAEREEAEAFVALLLESAAAPLEEARIYVAITMRSEYLGAAALIDGLSEAINRGLYLTPRMSRDEVRDAIVGPAAVCGFEIEPALVNRLLNDLSSFAPWEEADTGHQLQRLVRRADQLPLMQHVLNRLWSIAAARGDKGRIVLTLKDYDSLGGLRGALAVHGREILEELLPEHRDVAPFVFRALTSGSSLAEAVRRPTEFGELVEIARDEDIAVREIVEAFRAPGRNFLMPPRPTPLHADTVIDISHESLIRQWDEFAGWLQDEINSADAWRRLVDQAERHRRGEANLLSGLALARLANWWDTEQPTAAWAKRYGGDFEQARKFLEQSRSAEAASKEAEAEERRRKSRNRLLTFAVVMVLCIITPLTIFAGYSAIRANEEAARALAARAEAEQAAERAESEKERADQERQRALEAQQEALQQAEAAEAARTEAEEAAQRAESEKERADQERQRALEAQQEALQQAEAAEAARQRALAARTEAEEAAQRAESEKERADQERQRALAAQQEALEQAKAAKAARARAEEQRLLAERARSDLLKANLELLGQRIQSLQQDAAWDAAGNLLGELWRDLITTSEQTRETWFIEPVRKAFARQNMAEYAVAPDFLNYAGLEGWSGTTGRFHVYALDPKPDAGGVATDGRSLISVFDTMTGAVTGSFELPAGLGLGSELDHVTPDGKRVAIIADDGELALWAAGQEAPTLIPVPSLEGAAYDVQELAPAHTDDRFLLLLAPDPSAADKDGDGEIDPEYAGAAGFIVVDPAEQAITFSARQDELAGVLGVEAINTLQVLGLVNNQIVLLVDKEDSRVVTVDVPSGTVGEVPVGSGVSGAAITPDGKVLLTLSCPSRCNEQQLTAFDMATKAPIWVDRVPLYMTLSESVAQETVVDGKPAYNVKVSYEGSGIVFQFPKGRPEDAVRLEGSEFARIGEVSFDGDHHYRMVEAASEGASVDGLNPAGVLATYRLPLNRQSLLYYVAPNSIAVYQNEDVVRIAGVTYENELLVYKLAKDGTFEEDLGFRRAPLVQSDCVAAIAFGGGGNSLLIRHVDGSLRYVAAVGHGASIGWHAPTSGGELIETSPATDCEAPSTSEDRVTARIVPVDRAGSLFAMLDTDGGVSWVNVVSGSGEAGDGSGETEQSGLPAAQRRFAPLRPAGTGGQWIAGDPQRGRIAIVQRGRSLQRGTDPGASRPGVDIVPYVAAEALSAGGPVEEQDTARSSGGGERHGATSGSQQGANETQRLARSGEPRAAVFEENGDLVVVYAGGELVVFRQNPDSWSATLDTAILKAPVAGVLAANGRIAVVDDRDMVTALDAESGALTSYARLPAHPSVVALKRDGELLSLEWDTNAVSTLTLSEAAPDGVEDAARLATMRSGLDSEGNATINALKREREMEGQSAPGEETVSAVPGCEPAGARTLFRVETSLMDGAPLAPADFDSPCPTSADDAGGLTEVAEALARRVESVGVRGLAEEKSFSVLLQAAAAGDAAALRLVGAVLARAAIERGGVGETAIAADAARFGASLPAALLKRVAAGAPIDPPLLAFARGRTGFDPAAHQYIAQALERRINDVGALTDALFHYSVAESLYRASGRLPQARFSAQRSAQLARLLPDARVLDVYARWEAWRPEAVSVDTAGDAPEVPDDAGERQARDIENADRLAEQLPDSPLLAALRRDLDRVRIQDIASEDPKRATDLLLELGRQANTGRVWSPGQARDYLTLAEQIEKRDGASAFRLATEALRLMGAAFDDPIHTNSEAVDLFARAADVAGSTTAEAPAELVSQALALQLPFLQYQYATLPGSGVAENLLADAERVQDAAALLAKALALRDDGTKWDVVEGDALFWKGVLVNDNDAPRAATIFNEAAVILKPAVLQDPQNLHARLRYAETLRWVGLTSKASEEVADTEREAIRQYATIWNDSRILDSELLRATGIGYGYALANLAWTLRQLNIVDLADGRSAEDHAGWVLEALALASEKDAVNSAMIDRGAESGDSNFVSGWYRMSSYGQPIGFLGGLVNVENGSGPVTDCDLRAADPYDPLRRAPGVFSYDLDGAAAETACLDAIKISHDPRVTYQLARAISTDSNRKTEYMPLARAAAEHGVAPAFTLVADALEDKQAADDARFAASQRTIIESFPILYPFLAEQASTERETMGLDWYVGKAARLGVPDAHLALAETADDPLLKLFHLRLAARLWDEAGNKPAAGAARRKAEAIEVSQADSDAVDTEVQAWVGEALMALPEDSGDSS
jgi:hypothetical protein